MSELSVSRSVSQSVSQLVSWARAGWEVERRYMYEGERKKPDMLCVSGQISE